MERHFALTGLALVTLALVLASPSTGRADPRAGRPTLDGHRIDVVIPSVGFGLFAAPDSDYSDEIGTVSVEVRYGHASGHGAMFRAAWGTNVWGEGYGVELDYLARAVLVGHDDLSLGVDFTLGTSFAWLDHTEQTLAAGPHVGGNAGLSLDLRAFNFILSLGAQYRILIPTEDRLDGEPAGPAHTITGTVGVGFTFY